MENKKRTRKVILGEILNLAQVQANEEYTTELNKIIAQLEKKNTKSGVTKTQKENEIVANMLVDELEKVGKPITITDLMNASEVIKEYRLENGNALSNQKISAIFKQLVENKTLVKVIDKKKSYFSIAE